MLPPDQKDHHWMIVSTPDPSLGSPFLIFYSASACSKFSPETGLSHGIDLYVRRTVIHCDSCGSLSPMRNAPTWSRFDSHESCLGYLRALFSWTQPSITIWKLIVNQTQPLWTNFSPPSMSMTWYRERVIWSQHTSCMSSRSYGLRMLDSSRKFVTNSEELRHLIQEEPSSSGGEIGEPTHAEEDQSYAKSSLGTHTEERPGISKILGVQWDVAQDEFLLDLGDMASIMENYEPTKGTSLVSRQGFSIPSDLFLLWQSYSKCFASNSSRQKMDWDEPLSGPHLENWNCLLRMLRGAKTVRTTQCLFSGVSQPLNSARLVGFCDASNKAYAAVVYLRLETEARQVTVRFVAAKTWVAPVGGATIPRLELLSALVLSKLMDSIHTALEPELRLGDPVCFSDSMVALFWIQGTNHEWKQFVENWVNTIRSLVAPQHWKHCLGKENPADIPSRGMSASELADTRLWFHGPEWLHHSEGLQEELTLILSVPEECKCEMRRRDAAHLLVNVQDHGTSSLSKIIDPEWHSSAYRLFRITGLVLSFIRHLRERVSDQPSDTSTQKLSLSNFEQARLLWIKDCQSHLQEDSRFASWERRLDLFMDTSGVWRCGGRMSKSCLLSSAKNPLLLDRNQHLTRLIVADAHLRVLHNGVKETLTELQSEYWLVKGRQFVRKIIHRCTTCKRLEGKSCRGNRPPPLPEYLVQPSRPLQTTGVDFAGPLFVKTPDVARTSKVWLCLYTCC